jgi:MFS family permease
MNVLLKNRTLVIIGIAESVSGIGDWITMMAVLAILVFRGGGGVMETSGVFLAGLLPTLVSSPFAGWLVDRVDRKALMIGSQILSGLAVLVLFFTSRQEVIYGILALEAVFLSVMTPARQAVVPDLVDRSYLVRANAFLQQLAGLVKVFSPVIAGLILSVMSPHSAILLDVVSFFLAAGVLTFLPRLAPKGGTEKSRNDNSKTIRLGRVFLSLPQLKMLFFGVFVAIFAIIGFDVLSSVFFRDVLHQGEKAFGFAIGLVGIGSIFATTILMLRKKKVNLWKDLLLGYALLSIIPLALVIAFQTDDLQNNQIAVLVACLIGGIGNGLVHVQIGTILQLVTPSEILGQVGGWLQTTMVAGQLLGLILTPILVPGLVSMAAFFTGTFLVFVGLLVILLVQIFGKTKLNTDVLVSEI